MGVISGFHPPDGHRPSRAVGAHEGGLDRDAAEVFLRAQSAWLRRGLTHGEDREVVRLVLNSHETSHESWLALIAAAERHLGAPVAQVLGAVYTGHGRVAGTLERGATTTLSAEVATRVRDLLATHLAALTEAAVAALHGALSSSDVLPPIAAPDRPGAAVEAMADEG